MKNARPTFMSTIVIMGMQAVFCLRSQFREAPTFRLTALIILALFICHTMWYAVTLDGLLTTTKKCLIVILEEKPYRDLGRHELFFPAALF